MNKISFVYFDVGGVLIQDFSETDRWSKLYSDLGVKPEDYEKIEKLFAQHVRKLNTVLDADAFLLILKKELNLNIPPGYSLLEDTVKRFLPNKSIWPVVKAVQKKYRTGLLTNMYPKMLEEIKSAKLLPPGKWDVVVDSSIEGVQKPDSVIFEIATKWTGEPHENILFIDNTLKNIKRANSVGWQTFHYDPSDYKKSSADLEKFLKL